MSSKIHTDMMQLLKQMENPYLRGIDLQLVRMENLMNALGRPDQQLPPVIHVAGTNGKGSLLAYLRAMFEAAGHCVHRYTSPHLVRFNERVVLAGKEVGDAELYDVLRRVHALRHEFPATLFEAVTAAAFLLFIKKPADVLLLEVGMGGRLDATNVVQTPKITAITPVSRDHEEFLGSEIGEIAAEKAGILKPGVPCVVGPQLPEALKVIEKKAGEIGSPLFRFGHEWRMEQTEDGYDYVSERQRLPIPVPPLGGEHQWANAATAIACMELWLGNGSGLETMVQGIARASWPARLQPLYVLDWLAYLPRGSEIWLDGGHNPAAGEILAGWLRQKTASGMKCHLACGMMQTKDAGGFLKPIAPYVAQVWTVPIPDEPKAFPPQELEKIASGLGMKAMAAPSVNRAIEASGKISGGEPVLVLIAGSLYLAGAVLAEKLSIA